MEKFTNEVLLELVAVKKERDELRLKLSDTDKAMRQATDIANEAMREVGKLKDDYNNAIDLLAEERKKVKVEYSNVQALKSDNANLLEALKTMVDPEEGVSETDRYKFAYEAIAKAES